MFLGLVLGRGTIIFGQQFFCALNFNYDVTQASTDHCHILPLVSLKSLESIGWCGRDPDSLTMDQ